MDEKKRAPKLRFKGFTDDWEQRKLGSLLIKMYNGQTPSRNNPSFWNGNINWLTSGELNHSYITSTQEKITKGGQSNANLKIVPAGTFVIAITGLEAVGTRGNDAILSIDTAINQSVMAMFNDKTKITTKFLFYWYEKIGNYYGIKYTQGTKQQSYNAELISKLPISIPRQLNEQNNIGNLLQILNKIISLQQRKLDQLKLLKKAMLQQLFTDNKIPILRFKGFSSAWEQRKLESVVQYLKGFAFKSVNYIESGTRLIRVSDLGVNSIKEIDSNAIFLPDLFKSKYRKYLIKENDIIITTVGSKSFQENSSVGKAIIFNESYPALLNQNLVRIRGRINSVFLFSQLSSKKYKFFISTIERGNANQANIAIKDMLGYKIYLSDESEQNKIGDLLKKVNKIIILQQQDINRLEQMKKYLLQNMFI